jgi:hypothetical protein
MDSSPGRFCVNLDKMRNMKDVAESLYPERQKVVMERRRGDRLNERFLSTSEHIEKHELNNEVCRITSDHD